MVDAYVPVRLVDEANRYLERVGFAVGFLLVYCAYSWALELGIGIGLIVHIEIYICVTTGETSCVTRYYYRSIDL